MLVFVSAACLTFAHNATIEFAHEAQDCWLACGQAQGACNFCGSSGACCRRGFAGSPAECGFGAAGCTTTHCCSAPPAAPPTRLAFATYLCKPSGKTSTFDRPGGEGAELGALVHGHAIRALHGSRIDSLLLHVVIPGTCSDLRFRAPIERKYTRVVRLDGSTVAEKSFFSRMHHQPHLWLKLLVLNLTVSRVCYVWLAGGMWAPDAPSRRSQCASCVTPDPPIALLPLPS